MSDDDATRPAEAARQTPAEASLALHGQKSYYYWHAGVGARAPSATPELVGRASLPAGGGGGAPLACRAIERYAWYDDDACVRVVVPLPGVGALPPAAVACEFGARSCACRVGASDAATPASAAATDSATDANANREPPQQLTLQPLAFAIDPARSTAIVKRDKLVLKLVKAEPDKLWVDLLARK